MIDHYQLMNDLYKQHPQGSVSRVQLQQINDLMLELEAWRRTFPIMRWRQGAQFLSVPPTEYIFPPEDDEMEEEE